MSSTGIARGKDKGFPTSHLAKETKPARLRGRQGARSKAVREVIRDAAGLQPYEKRCLDMMKTSGEKAVYKMIKARLGTHRRALRKKDDLQQVLAALRARQNA